MTKKSEDHLDRFAKIAKSLGISKPIAKKLASFIHYEVMSVKMAPPRKVL